MWNKTSSYARLRQYFHVIGNLMQDVFDAIDKFAELTLAWYNLREDGQHCFFLEEQSLLQILRELPSKSKLVVAEVFSQTHRVEKKSDVIRKSKTVLELLDQTLPVVENGSFPCDILSITVENTLTVISRHDYSVELKSNDLGSLKQLIYKIFMRQGYFVDLVDEIARRPKLYHQLERPNIIGISNAMYDE
jgi:hypothetical protein